MVNAINFKIGECRISVWIKWWAILMVGFVVDFIVLGFLIALETIEALMRIGIMIWYAPAKFKQLVVRMREGAKRETKAKAQKTRMGELFRRAAEQSEF